MTPPPRSPEDRLDSWKEIASYLQRSVRTVRRWEQGEKLPVHRHRHEKGSTVYAFRSELDRWQVGRKAAVASPAAPEAGGAVAGRPDSDAARPPARRTGVPALAAALVALIAALLILVGRGPLDRWSGGSEPPPAPVRLLLTALDGPSQESELAGAAASLLRLELERLPAVELAAKGRIEETLGLMRLPAGTRVGADLGREIAFRDAGIVALLAARLEPLGRHHRLSLDLIDPTTGSSLAGAAEKVNAVEDLEGAVAGLTRRFGNALPAGLAAVEPRPRPLARVATASTRALELYSLAMEVMEQGDESAVAELLRQALAKDPQFASAQIELAWSLRDLGGPPAEYRALAESAWEAAGTVPDRERFYIQAGRHHLAGDEETARASYAALLSLDPAHFLGNLRALELCRSREGVEGCADYAVRLADLRPAVPRWNYEAARSLLLVSGDPERARPYVVRLRALLPAMSPADPRAAVLSELFPVYRLWLADDLTAALAAERDVERRLEALPPAIRDALHRELGALDLTLGRLRVAETRFRRISDPILRHEMLARVLFARGDGDALRNHLADGTAYREPFTAILLSMVGLEPEARRLLEELEAAGAPPESIEIVRGRLAVASGRPEAGMQHFEQGLAGMTLRAEEVYFAGADMLSMVLKKQGDLRGGMRVLEMTASQRSRAAFLGTSMFWMKCQGTLASLYREIGREEDAQAIETILLDLLRHADADHPMRLQLERRSAAAA